MKVFTQEEFDAIPRDVYGIKHCPSGDYSTIKGFPAMCVFGEGCRFGYRCSFDMWCVFGEHCDFCLGCSFGNGCHFGEGCVFDDDCRFGAWCRFGERCDFGAGCRFENGHISNGRYVAVDRIGSEARKAYFFRGDEGLFVRAGCWFGTFDEFEQRVHKVHKGTRHERDYINALIFARGMLEDE